ncbi:AraC family transcriptional regulator ligand-binding domain-containing protein [Nocardia sp. NPDC051052]|uniref:AraC family transcriptional regulator n=1 Tax=Nocardia sp. NPDC051052 TaxID=3364322 RepID=UPI0037BE0BF0
MPVMARAACLRGYCALVDQLGGDGRTLLGRFDIDTDTIDSDDTLIAAESIGWALEAAAADVRRPDFGLRLAASQQETVLGPLAVALAHAPTVGAAIACAARFLFIQHAGLSIALVPDPEGESDVVALHYRDPAEATGFSQGVDLAAGTIHRALRRVFGEEPALRSVHLPHEALISPSVYTEHFGTDVRFSTPTTMFRFPAAVLERPVPGSSPVVRAMAMDYLTKNYSELDRTISARVRVSIEQSIGTAIPDIRDVARMLSMHERTLQRTLAAEGTSFREILDESRRDVVYRLLRETELSMSRITSLVGLGEQSALTRVVRRWYGMTPQQIRNAARVERGERPSIRLRRTVSR